MEQPTDRDTRLHRFIAAAIEAPIVLDVAALMAERDELKRSVQREARRAEEEHGIALAAVRRAETAAPPRRLPEDHPPANPHTTRRVWAYLTARQRSGCGAQSSVRETASALGLTPAMVRRAIKALTAQGYVSSAPGRTGTLRVLLPLIEAQSAQAQSAEREE